MVSILVSVFVRWKRLVKLRRQQRSENNQKDLSLNMPNNDEEKYNNGSLPKMIKLTDKNQSSIDDETSGNLLQNNILNKDDIKINEDGSIKNKYPTNSSTINNYESIDMNSQKKINEYSNNIITKNYGNLNHLGANKVFPANTVYLNPSSVSNMLDNNTEIFELKIQNKKT